jgi:ribonuclease E
VSSVALQLLRSIEEMLLKGPTHNLIIRTRPEIALYVLNHKRAHLRQMEEHFQVALTVNADEEVGGQIGFTIDRGEQVMTIDQAKALLAQAALAAPALHEDAEPDFPEEVDEESEPATSESESEHSEYVEHTGNVDEVPDSADDHQPLHSDGARENDDGSRDSRGRPRRRRRRGRGGRGEGREGAPFQPRHEHGSPEAGGYAPDPAQGFASPGGEEHASGDMAPQDADFTRPQPEGGEAHSNGDGEIRRRRRGRRGGRRNRRDGGPGNGDFAATEGSETHERSDHSERPDWSPPHEASPPDTSAAYASPPEPIHQPEPAPQPMAAAPQPSAEGAPPRRRSTVREPAPVSSSAPAMTPAPPPPPAPVVTSTAEADAKPKRSGWWAKRLLGG